jgi:hypothetical protein
MSLSAREHWLILTRRYGGDVRQPTVGELRSALAEIYHENHAGLTESDYAEHPNAWLRFGFDDGPMYVLDVYRGGRVHFSQWADPDYGDELEPEAIRSDVGEVEALLLWELLAAGEIDQIKGRGWNAT